MRFGICAIAVIMVLCLSSYAEAQFLNPVAPVYVQPPPVVFQPAPIIVQQPAYPAYLYQRHYWTPVRDFLFGRYRIGPAIIYQAPQK